MPSNLYDLPPGEIRVNYHALDDSTVIRRLTDADLSAQLSSLQSGRTKARVFKQAPDRLVRVEGHTAVAVSSPESLKSYPTSWHLGGARAANVVRYLQDKCGMDPLQLVASSLGQYRPRADNSTEGGKAQNRRVDFVLIARPLWEIQQLKEATQAQADP